MQTKTKKYGHPILTPAGFVNRALLLAEMGSDYWADDCTIRDHMNDAMDLLNFGE